MAMEEFTRATTSRQRVTTFYTQVNEWEWRYTVDQWCESYDVAASRDFRNPIMRPMYILLARSYLLM